MSSWFENLAQLYWANPAWGLLALQPVLMWLLMTLRRRQILHYADAHLLVWVVRNNAALAGSRSRAVFNFAAWILLAAALAGPRLPLFNELGQQGLSRHELDVMVVLDVSPSMYAQDVSPQRLQRAKLELLDILPRLRGERVGLVAFSGSAGLLMPLNRDYAALPYYLNIAEPTLFAGAGTALASALDLALRHMPESSSTPRAILLLTDAEANALSGPAGAALWEAADKLKQANVPLYILGVGSEAGSTIILPDGNAVVYEGADVLSNMDADGFADLAAKTGGKFVAVSDGDGDSRALYDNGLLNVPGGKQRAESVEAWQEMYGVFLLPALLIFLLLNFSFKETLIKSFNKLPSTTLRTNGNFLIPFVVSLSNHVRSTLNQSLLNLKRYFPLIFAVMLLPLADITWHEAQAAELNISAKEHAAYEAYRNHQHAQAQTLYGDVHGHAGRMGEGAAAYRRKDYAYAIKQFSAALLQARTENQREQALFNLGNSYFLAGAYRPAAEAFKGVLQYTPDNQNARANLALAAGKLAEIIKPAKNSNGVVGRRGREVGGLLGEDASDKSLAMESAEEKKVQQNASSQPIDCIKLFEGHKGEIPLLEATQATGLERDVVYRVALKKLELTLDQPIALHKALIKFEVEREYVPLPEMMPW
jgi:Ca-activated chloride channel family protein